MFESTRRVLSDYKSLKYLLLVPAVALNVSATKTAEASAVDLAKEASLMPFGITEKAPVFSLAANDQTFGPHGGGGGGHGPGQRPNEDQKQQSPQRGQPPVTKAPPQNPTPRKDPPVTKAPPQNPTPQNPTPRKDPPVTKAPPQNPTPQNPTPRKDPPVTKAPPQNPTPQNPTPRKDPPVTQTPVKVVPKELPHDEKHEHHDRDNRGGGVIFQGGGNTTHHDDPHKRPENNGDRWNQQIAWPRQGGPDIHFNKKNFRGPHNDRFDLVRNDRPYGDEGEWREYHGRWWRHWLTDVIIVLLENSRENTPVLYQTAIVQRGPELGVFISERGPDGTMIAVLKTETQLAIEQRDLTFSKVTTGLTNEQEERLTLVNDGLKQIDDYRHPAGVPVQVIIVGDATDVTNKNKITALRPGSVEVAKMNETKITSVKEAAPV